MEDKRNIQIIEWEHLDKKKFYVFGVAMTMMIRVSVYPFTLIRTRLQVQKGKSLYHGTFDAFIKILRADGVTGLYRGFLVNTFTLISGQCYVTTYELTRKFVADYSQSNTVKSLVAGGSASLVAQSITVPIDVVSQHLMMQRKGERMGRFQVRGSPEGRGIVAFGQTKDIIRQILRADGLRGFYRGYVASLLTYIPNSAVWWPFYHFYAAVSGPLAAATASILTNPMDVIRTRVQVEGKSSIILTFRQLMAEEGPWGLMKGLSARIISATPSTIVIVVGYESLKKLSLRPELVDSRHWSHSGNLRVVEPLGFLISSSQSRASRGILGRQEGAGQEATRSRTAALTSPTLPSCSGGRPALLPHARPPPSLRCGVRRPGAEGLSEPALEPHT
ncbi:solute carrier family 25 member 44 isoform X2 [Eumetopias jubatus]|uniref:solute carrier family 25 member 44 isoform X2 n=1 Tax=Eumetopias jubatus TaxID=34886 RepID=UPI001016117D|nr:solute carrier family 25 member 44 isoform X2 [Eumetopias jubatus]